MQRKRLSVSKLRKNKGEEISESAKIQSLKEADESPLKERKGSESLGHWEQDFGINQVPEADEEEETIGEETPTDYAEEDSIPIIKEKSLIREKEVKELKEELERSVIEQDELKNTLVKRETQMVKMKAQVLVYSELIDEQNQRMQEYEIIKKELVNTMNKKAAQHKKKMKGLEEKYNKYIDNLEFYYTNEDAETPTNSPHMQRQISALSLSRDPNAYSQDSQRNSPTLIQENPSNTITNTTIKTLFWKYRARQLASMLFNFAPIVLPFLYIISLKH